MSDYHPGDHNVQEVVDYASEHPDEVAAILEAEQGDKNRSTLVSQLQAMDPGADLLVTTTMTKDYLNRNLTNPTPGTSNATDHLGRAVTAGNKDFAGRALH